MYSLEERPKYAVTIEGKGYRTNDPVMFKSLISKGYKPEVALDIVDEILRAVNMIFDGMCMALTFWPPHKIEYHHPCPDGSTMVLLIEKRA